MKGIPDSVESEVIIAVIESKKTLISRSLIEHLIESNPDKFPIIIKSSPLQRRKWISTAMNRKFLKTIGNAWIITEGNYVKYCKGSDCIAAVPLLEEGSIMWICSRLPITGKAL